MSTYGGDSWAREAQHRKRRVDELILESTPVASPGSSSQSFRRLANGKLVCIICPNRPTLDSPLMLSMHNKSSRHVAAEARAKDKELSTKAELSKRIALSSDAPTLSGVNCKVNQARPWKVEEKPLIEQTRAAILEAQSCKNKVIASTYGIHNLKSISSICSGQPATDAKVNSNASAENGSGDFLVCSSPIANQRELQQRQDKELKFISSGWKRDCHGKWYRDENVEFDSDEEDPNECLL